ncbi:MAG: hypothetical protein PHH11_06615 [Methylomonas sp.]|nr:hypothetical protein [Methylomonas sp.]
MQRFILALSACLHTPLVNTETQLTMSDAILSTNGLASDGYFGKLIRAKS